MNALFNHINKRKDNYCKRFKRFGWCRIIIFVSFQLFALSAFSQLFISAEINYPFFAADYNISEINTDSRISFNNPKLKAAGTPSISADMGFAITRFLSIEAELEYFENIISWQNEYKSSASSQSPYEGYSDYNRFFEGFLFRPGFVLSRDKTKDFVPYIKLGAVIANIDQRYESSDYIYYYNGENFNEVKNTEYDYDIQCGITSALGFEFKFSKIFVPYLEAKLDFISLSPSSSSVTKWERNNEDILSVATYQERYTTYVDNYSYDELNENSPKKLLKDYEPFSRASGTFGIRIYFWKREPGPENNNVSKN